VRELFSRVRRWWGASPRRPAADEPFDVACGCGQHARGLRQARHQVVRCLACGDPVFVLGLSPLAGAETASPTSGAPRRRYWIGPALAAGVTVALAVAVFSLVIPALAPAPPPGDAAADDVRPLIAAGRQALRDEDFRIAATRLREARQRHAARPTSLSAVEARGLIRLERQAALIADLLSESLDEILRRAAGTRAEERQAQFDLRYRDKAVIFDDVVTRDATGRFELAVYEVRAPGEAARIELNELKLLKALPLAEPHRMLFGARLASLGREERGGHGVWVIHLDPDSGVLLTEEETAGACCPRPLDDDLRAVLQRQAEWAATLP